jgi:hypothetical protein
MSQSPWKQGDREPYWEFGLQPDDDPLDVTGFTTADFSLIFIDASGNERIGDGIFTDLTAASGSSAAMITYQQSSNDVAETGVFDRRVVIKRNTIHQRTFEFGKWACER